MKDLTPLLTPLFYTQMRVGDEKKQIARTIK